MVINPAVARSFCAAAALLGGAFLATSEPARGDETSSKLDRFVAQLETPVSSSTQFQAGAVQWSCDQDLCTGDGKAAGQKGIMAACRELVARVGRLQSFRSGEQSLSARRLKRCQRLYHIELPDGIGLSAMAAPRIHAAFQHVDQVGWALSEDVVLRGRLGEQRGRTVRIIGPHNSLQHDAPVRVWQPNRVVVTTPTEILRGDSSAQYNGLTQGYQAVVVDDAGREISNRAPIVGQIGGEAAYCDHPKDEDGDGVVSLRCGGADCDDLDPRRFPGNPEVCDDTGHDEDCDPTTFGDRDSDDDRFVSAQCLNSASNDEVFRGRDCDDSRPGIHPASVEVCDGLDNDCDGEVDEGVDIVLYRDADGDSFGSATQRTRKCHVVDGWSVYSTDCNDEDRAVSPVAVERPDGVDNDCDGAIDE